jgi:hypothetical protein
MAHHAAVDRHADRADRQQQDHGHRQALGQHGPHLAIDVVHVQARADDPVPGRHRADVLQLGHRFGLARARELHRDVRVAVGALVRTVDQGGDDIDAGRIHDLAHHVLPAPLGLERVHHAHAVVAPDEEVVRIAVGPAEARATQGVGGRLLRRLHAHLAPFGLLLVRGGDAALRLHRHHEAGLAAFDDLVAQRPRRAGREQHDAGDGHAGEQGDLVLEGQGTGSGMHGGLRRSSCDAESHGIAAAGVGRHNLRL